MYVFGNYNHYSLWSYATKFISIVENVAGLQIVKKTRDEFVSSELNFIALHALSFVDR